MARRRELSLFSIRIRQHRKRYRLSQPGLARELDRLAWERTGSPPTWMALGVNGCMVSRWERGTLPSERYRELLCALFDATPYELGFREALPREAAAGPARCASEGGISVQDESSNEAAAPRDRPRHEIPAHVFHPFLPHGRLPEFLVAGRLGLDHANAWTPRPLLWLAPVPGSDMEPLNRRTLLGRGVALGFGATLLRSAPASAAEVDPDLVPHWLTLLDALGKHDRVVGPRAVLGIARAELALIEQHREAARGVIRTDIQKVEARWADYAAWLSDDTGDSKGADYWLGRATALAADAGDRLMVSFVLAHQSRLACDQRDTDRAIALAESAQQIRGITPAVQALAALREARARAQADDMYGCQRKLDEAYERVECGHPPGSGTFESLAFHSTTRVYVHLYEADCWLRLKRPDRAVSLFEQVLEGLPDTRPRDRGLHGARLAVASAAAGTRDRAAAEGIRATEIAKTTRSERTLRELRRLDRDLAGFSTRAAAEFREALASV